jgi:hypothetical protein
MDVTTADLDVELPAGHPLLAALREVAEYKDLGAETWMLPGPDLDPYAELREMGMVTWTYEPNGDYAYDGRTPTEVLIIRITERGLEELVVHGRAR